MARKGTVGMPGTKEMPPRRPEQMAKAFGWARIWVAMSWPRLALGSSEATRVTMRPAVIEPNRAGICDTSPSPMVRMPKRCRASKMVKSSRVLPMIRPATMLTTLMMRPAMASPLTNFIAPSIEPKSCDSRLRSARRRRASSRSKAPARRSASMLICLPGMASRVNRAATSATRSAPLATTRN